MEITPVHQPRTSKALANEKRSSLPYPVVGVPGAHSAALPIDQLPVPRAPNPTSYTSSGDGTTIIQSPGSLIGIVEDIARRNRQTEEQLRVLKSGGTLGKMDLEVATAPTRVHRDMLGSGNPGSAANSSVGSASGVVRKATTGSSRPAQSPLKSALRNPSPMGSTGKAAPPRKERRLDDAEDGGESSEYETPWDGEVDEERAKKVSGPRGQGQAHASGASAPVGTGATGSGVTSQPPVQAPSTETPTRRKSVRVSLQPTFSPSPVYDQEYDESPRGFRPIAPDRPTRSRSKFLTQPMAGPATASGSGVSRGASRREKQDIWQDSDEEDEEYARAKMALQRAGQEEKKVYATATIIG